MDAARYGIISTTYTLPEMRNSKINLKPEVIYDEVMGTPIGYKEPACELMQEFMQNMKPRFSGKVN
jgi:hypothetical protein